MASERLRRAENVPGDLYVDSTCIDCDTCRWMAPETFAQAGDMSAVVAQPADGEAWLRALQALVSCPTASIGTVSKHALAPVLASLPIELDAHAGTTLYHCGYHDESSFGAASYLIRRPAERGGNVLVDAPRFAGPLVKRLEELGGVATMFLTHRDDVGDHARFREHFGCERVLHRDDATGALRGLERLLEGTADIALDDELTVVPVPGHTRGSCCLLWRSRWLFSGDHVAWSERLGQVHAFRRACWYDWDMQVESMRRLARHDFEWILPGHGRRCRFEADRMRDEMARAIAWMQAA